MSLSVAIVGCGKIADAHAEQIRRIKECALVAACDREELMARQFAERFEAPRYFDNLDQLLEEARPEVVHVTTPPQSHFTIARQCLEHGCHVYVEKPFTLNAREAEVLVGLAERRGLRLTVGHHFQFSHAARRVRSLIRQGYLGDEVVHMESHYGYDLGDPAYARAFLDDGVHWVRMLPGRIAPERHQPRHRPHRRASQWGEPPSHCPRLREPVLRRLCGEEVVDELRATVVDERGTTAYFTFSSQMRPGPPPVPCLRVPQRSGA